MKLNVKYLQEGGMALEAMGPEAGAPEASAPAEAPAEAGIEEQVMQMAQQIAQQIGDHQVIGMLGEALIQIAQSAAQPQAPAYQRQGGRLVRIK